MVGSKGVQGAEGAEGLMELDMFFINDLKLFQRFWMATLRFAQWGCSHLIQLDHPQAFARPGVGLGVDERFGGRFVGDGERFAFRVAERSPQEDTKLLVVGPNEEDTTLLVAGEGFDESVHEWPWDMACRGAVHAPVSFQIPRS